ncbi:hypothetical protein GC176_04290 [bacterium]|nr:hypothetical protein [bacterium]
MKPWLHLCPILLCLSLSSCGGGSEPGQTASTESRETPQQAVQGSDSSPKPGAKAETASKQSPAPADAARSKVPSANVANRPALSFIPQDAVVTVVVHPKRAASSDPMRALLELDFVRERLEASSMKLNDIERVIYSAGIPTDESENDCTIVQYAQPRARADLLKDEFGDLPYEETNFRGVTYFRFADVLAPGSDDIEPREAKPKPAPPGNSAVLARYPDDFCPNANGHVDASDSGNWIYQSAERQNPLAPEATLRKLHWDAGKRRYESPRGAMGNEYPTIGNSLDPSPRSPRFAVLRWQSRTAAETRIRGNFRKYSNAKNGDGVLALIFVDGQQKFSTDLRFNDTTGSNFDIRADVHPGSFIDFVIDPKGNSSYDSTNLTATIEKILPSVANGPPVERDVPDEAADPPLAGGSGIYLLDDRTILRADERRLRSLLSNPPAQSPLAKKLAQADLNHDLVAVVAFEGNRDPLAKLLAPLNDDGGPIDLRGVSALPQHAQFAVAHGDLSGGTLLRVTVDTPDAQAAAQVEGGLDALLESTEGLREIIPRDNPILGMIRQILMGTKLQSNGPQVVLDVKMPNDLADFIRRDAMAAIAPLARTATQSQRETLRKLEEREREIEAMAARDLARQAGGIPVAAIAAPKHAVPDEHVLAAAQARVRQVYKRQIEDARTDEQKAALTVSILDDATGFEDATQKFAALEVARQMAVALPDVAMTFRTIQQLEDEFQIDALAVRIDSLRELGNSGIDAQERMPFVERLTSVADQAVAADLFDAGVELLQLARKYALQARESARLREITDRLSDVTKLAADFAALEPARKTLQTNAFDPEACLSVGRFRCFAQGDWEAGLKLLAQCSDRRLQAPAASDLAAPRTVAEQIAAGDRWWELAAEYRGLEQKQIRLRAAHWYRAALPSARDLDRQKIEHRLEEIEPLETARPAVNLLDAVDLRRDVVSGHWIMRHGMLTSPEDSGARVVIPYDLPAEYDLTLVVSRRTNNNQFALGLTVDGVLTMILFDYQNSKRTTLFTSPQITFLKPVFTNNKSTKIIVSVRKRSLSVVADDQEILKWDGQSTLPPRIAPDWTVPDGTKLFVGSSSSVFQIQQLRLEPHR